MISRCLELSGRPLAREKPSRYRPHSPPLWIPAFAGMTKWGAGMSIAYAGIILNVSARESGLSRHMSHPYFIARSSPWDSWNSSSGSLETKAVL